MGKGNRKGQQSGKRQKSASPEPEVEEIGEEELDIEELEAQLSDEDEGLLMKIDEEIMAADEPIKLAWAAIHHLKKQEKDINQEMEKELKQLQKKYELLRHPIAEKIAKVASGNAVEKQIYTSHQYTKTLNVNKHKPKAIPGYWSGVLETLGLISCQEDQQMFSVCHSLICSVDQSSQTDEETVTVKLSFGENKIFKNSELVLSIHRKGDEFTKKEQTKIDFTGNIPEQSLLVHMFNSETEPPLLYQHAHDFYKAYTNSVSYYFNLGGIEGGEEGAGEGLDDENGYNESEDGDDDDDDDDSEDIKPIKKQKKSNGPPIEKPECKQQ